jgi:hypothetical protein
MARHRGDDEVRPLDPIALALAVWFGVIAGATGLVRMSQDASVRIALAQAAAAPPSSEQDQTPLEPAALFNLRLMAPGG